MQVAPVVAAKAGMAADYRFLPVVYRKVSGAACSLASAAE